MRHNHNFQAQDLKMINTKLLEGVFMQKNCKFPDLKVLLPKFFIVLIFHNLPLKLWKIKTVKNLGRLHTHINQGRFQGWQKRWKIYQTPNIKAKHFLYFESESRILFWPTSSRDGKSCKKMSLTIKERTFNLSQKRSQDFFGVDSAWMFSS